MGVSFAPPRYGAYAPGSYFTGVGSPTPPAQRGNPGFSDELQMLVGVNAADFIDPASYSEQGAKLQAALDYTNSLAMKIKDSGFDNLNPRGTVRLWLPRSHVYVANMLHVPDFVEFDGPGIVVRNGHASSNTTDTFLPSLVNPYIPTLAFSAATITTRLNLTCNDGTVVGAGAAWGWGWQLASVALATAGTGYAANDVITLTTGSLYEASPTIAATITVNTIGAGGSIATFTLTTVGVYTVRPSKQTATLAQASTTGSGTGATFTPTWAADFASGSNDGVFNCKNLSTSLTCATIIGKVNISTVYQTPATGGGISTASNGSTYSTAYGPCFGALLIGNNYEVDSIITNSGDIGILQRATDVHVRILNPVLAKVGIYANSTFEFFADQVICDSCEFASIQLEQVGGVRLRGNVFWSNGNDGVSSPAQSGYQIIIGKVSGFAPASISLDIRFDNAGNVAGTAIPLYAYYMTDYEINLQVSNTGGFGTYSKSFGGFAYLGSSVTSSGILSGKIDGVAGGIFSGPFYNNFPGGMNVFDASAGGYARPFGTYELYGSAAPVNGTTGQYKAGPGSTYHRGGASPTLYANTGTAASPTWSAVTGS